jgi:hypothetical protein
LGTAVRPVSIQDDPDAFRPRALDDLIHNFKPGPAFQIWIKIIVDAIRDAGGIKELVAIRKANGVES